MKKIYLLSYLFFSVFSSADNSQTAIDLLQRLQKNNEWCRSISCEIQTRYYLSKDQNAYGDIDMSFIRDNNRCQAIGSCTVYKDGVIFEEASHAKFDVMNGKQYLYALGGSKDLLFQGSIKETGYQEHLNDLLNDPDRAGALWGRIYGNRNLDIYEILSNATDLSYTISDQKTAGEKQCYELKGSSILGNVTIFLSAQQDMAPLGWIIKKRPGDYFNDSSLSVKSWTASYSTLNTEKINDYVIPTKGRMEFTIEYNDGKTLKNIHEYTVKNVTINPDIEALGAFKFDLPQNVPVYLETAPGIVYNFHDGKLVPNVDKWFFESLDNVTEQIKHEVKPETGETANKTPEISKKEEPATTPVPADISKVEDAKQEDAAKVSSSSMVALILAGVLVVGIGGWLLFRLPRRRNHA